MASKQAVTTQEKEQERLLDVLVKLTGGNLIRDENITKEGNKYVLPGFTSVEEDVEFLQSWLAEQEEPTVFEKVYTYKVWDVSHATANALRGWFGSMRHTAKSWLEPPKMVSIPNGPGTTVQVPVGAFIVPALPLVKFSVDAVQDEKYGVVGRVRGIGPKKYADYAQRIFKLIENELQTNSLYRGKAFVEADKPEFLNTAAIDPSKIIYSEEVERQLKANVFVRLDHPSVLEALGISFKSAVLLEGEFGVGKTEALNLVAKRAVERGVTFIKVAPGGDLMQAMQTARMYSPAVVAFEDVDAVANADNESARIQAVLEAFDGQQAKLENVMVIITTNYVETLHKGMVRPGRIDSIIHIGPPDAVGIQRLIRARAERLLDPLIDWDAVAAAMQDYYPSFVVEATSCAVRHAVVRLDGPLNGQGLTTDDLVGGAEEVRPQFKLHCGAKTSVERPPLDSLFRDMIAEAVQHATGDIEQQTEMLAEKIEAESEETRGRVDDRTDSLSNQSEQETERIVETVIENT